MTQFTFSKFSSRFLGESGILQLMDDLGQAALQKGVIMLGGGNPGHIPQVQQIFRERMGRILDSEYDFENFISNYSAPGGDPPFLAALAEFFRNHFGWDIGPENIVLTNGSQTAFFMLFNMFAGEYGDGTRKKILLPLAPEYIGYEDAGIETDIFVSHRPQIEYHDNHIFKYHVDFDALTVDDTIGAICVSRPTNPTGNVLTEVEITKLSQLAAANNIPLIVDNAYGMPFPGIIYTDAEPTWQPGAIMCMSLSKLGLPGARTGIVVADERIIQAATGMNAVISLAPGSMGAYMALDVIRTGAILDISRDIIRPHYRNKVEMALENIHREFKGLPYQVHKPEGAFFLWLWFPDLPITSRQLYPRLKDRGVLIVPGEYFFPGLEEPWRHRQECIRLSYAADPDKVKQGIEIIGEELRNAWKLA